MRLFQDGTPQGVLRRGNRRQRPQGMFPSRHRPASGPATPARLVFTGCPERATIPSSDGCFLGAGCWHPDPVTLAGIRARIADHPQRWLAVRDDRQFAAHWVLAGDSLSRPPRGYAADHPAIDDIRRKDFIGLAPLSFAEATS